jgi:hypothetical protein
MDAIDNFSNENSIESISQLSIHIKNPFQIKTQKTLFKTLTEDTLHSLEIISFIVHIELDWQDNCLCLYNSKGNTIGWEPHLIVHTS